jgi:hypothetical protein
MVGDYQSMPSYYLLIPAVYGTLGPRTLLDTSVHPPVVLKLDCLLDLVPADDLFATFPCFFATERLGNALIDSRMSGVKFGRVRARVSEAFQPKRSRVKTLAILRLHVSGRPREHDFGLESNKYLVVSQAALDIARTFTLADCTVYDAANPPSPEKIMADLWAETERMVEKLRKERPA